MSWTLLSRTAAGALGTALGLVLITVPGNTPEAHACGCLAPPDPSVPIVQAGERILFAMQDGVVTAHIQIQYSGEPEQFAWLVPMPALPTYELGTDELFTQVISQTQPRYWVTTDTPEFCMQFPPPPPPPPPPPSAPPEGGPLVERGTLGPFDIAVLEADDPQAMLDWLAENRFFVPAGTDQAVTPYIRPGAYFLALKLQSGQSVGDLQPIVVKYQSELPQIPIVLTSVAADPDMPVLVWVLGDARAIPRNFFHTQINDARIDWLDNGSNYIEVINEAVDEADGHHSFITEYAGPSSVMIDRLDYEGRFGDRAELRTLTDPQQYLEFLWWHGYAQSSGPFGAQQISSQLVAILERELPIPQALIDAEAAMGQEITLASFYTDYAYYAFTYPEILEGAYPEFDPVALTDEIELRIVTPTLAAGQLFRDHPYLSRLFTTLSPDEMTKDPVFSFNPDLPEVSNVHLAELHYLECGPDGYEQFSGPALLVTEQGWRLFLPDGRDTLDWPDAPLPASFRIEMLREEGAAQVVTDNGDAIADGVDDYRPIPPGVGQPPPDPPATPGDDIGDGGCGCTTSPGTGDGVGMLMLALLVMLGMRRRRA
jgi:MYXO-CTERM domain-containing protein